jgi:hypothetical protein
MASLKDKENKIRHLLISLSLTHEEASQYLGLSRAYFSKLLNISNIEKQLDEIIDKLEAKFSKVNIITLHPKKFAAASGALADQVEYNSREGISIHLRYSDHSDETFIKLEGSDGSKMQIKIYSDKSSSPIELYYTEFSVALPGRVTHPQKIELISNTH